MHLTLTHYLATDPRLAADRLADAVAQSVDATASHLQAAADEVATVAVDDAVRVDSGLELLAGSTARVAGERGLTTLEVVVPWAETDAGAKYRGVHLFADTLAETVAAA